jgi:hypothetical protein
MNMLQRFEILFVVSTFAGLVGCSNSTGGDRHHPTVAFPAPRHDPGQEHDASVLYIDTSLSPLGEQFVKMKAIFHDVAVNDIRRNDLVWILSTDFQGHPPVLFAFPLGGLTRSEKERADPAFRALQEQLTRAIDQLVQVAKTTDLKTAEQLALNILQGQKRARRRRLVMTSDFILDVGPHSVTTEPPPAGDGLSASGVDVMLVVARPKPEYLAQLHLTPAALYNIVSTKWTQNFRDLGASSTSVRLVDAIPVGSQ